jgi:citrate lyase beta subunit
LGFVGKHVIHPSQVSIANQIYSPHEDEIVEARKVVASYEEAIGGNVGAIRLDEKLVDAVHYRKAKALLDSVKLV